MRKVLVLAVLLLGTNCFADSPGIFEIDGTLRSLGTNNIVGTFAGTVEIDTTTGSIVSYDIPMPGNLGLPPLTFASSNSHLGVFSCAGSTCINLNLFNRYDLDFSVAKNNLIGFTGSSFSGFYADSVGGASYNTSGTIASSVAPEPSGLLLMGSGLASMFVFRRSLSSGTLRRLG